MLAACPPASHHLIQPNVSSLVLLSQEGPVTFQNIQSSLPTLSPTDPGRTCELLGLACAIKISVKVLTGVAAHSFGPASLEIQLHMGRHTCHTAGQLKNSCTLYIDCSSSPGLDLDVDLGQDALPMRRSPQRRQVCAHGIHKGDVKLSTRHAQSALKHIVCIWVLQTHRPSDAEEQPGSIWRTDSERAVAERPPTVLHASPKDFRMDSSKQQKQQ